jgi:uncharacterized protein
VKTKKLSAVLRTCIVLCSLTVVSKIALAEAVLDVTGDEYFQIGDGDQEFRRLFDEFGVQPSRRLDQLMPNDLQSFNRLPISGNKLITPPVGGAFQSNDTQTPKEVLEVVRMARAELAYAARRNGAVRASTPTPNTKGAGMLQLGLLYLHGIEFPKQPTRAMELFLRARLAGNSTAQIAIAWCLLDGCGRGRNLDLFERHLGALQRVNQGRAQYFLYIAEQSKPKESQVGTLSSRGQAALLHSAELKDRQAFNELGLQAIKEKRVEVAIQHFEQAFKLGSNVARRNLVAAQRLLTQAQGTNPAQASSEQLDAGALFERANNLHRVGSNINDYSNAITLYRQSAARGDVRAVRMLSLIFSRPNAQGGVDVAWMKQTSQIEATPSLGVFTSAPSASFSTEETGVIDLLPEQFVGLRRLSN